MDLRGLCALSCKNNCGQLGLKAEGRLGTHHQCASHCCKGTSLECLAESWLQKAPDKGPWQICGLSEVLTGAAIVHQHASCPHALPFQSIPPPSRLHIDIGFDLGSIVREYHVYVPLECRSVGVAGCGKHAPSSVREAGKPSGPQADP